MTLMDQVVSIPRQYPVCDITLFLPFFPQYYFWSFKSSAQSVYREANVITGKFRINLKENYNIRKKRLKFYIVFSLESQKVQHLKSFTFLKACMPCDHFPFSCLYTHPQFGFFAHQWLLLEASLLLSQAPLHEQIALYPARVDPHCSFCYSAT